jgi:hypothetical protein
MRGLCGDLRSFRVFKWSRGANNGHVLCGIMWPRCRRYRRSQDDQRCKRWNEHRQTGDPPRRRRECPQHPPDARSRTSRRDHNLGVGGHVSFSAYERLILVRCRHSRDCRLRPPGRGRDRVALGRVGQQRIERIQVACRFDAVASLVMRLVHFLNGDRRKPENAPGIESTSAGSSPAYTARPDPPVTGTAKRQRDRYLRENRKLPGRR